MGIDYNGYAGPYFVCRTRMVEGTKATRGCPNETCPAYGEHIYDWRILYCWLCGAAIAKVKQKEPMQEVSIYEAREAIPGDVLSPVRFDDDPLAHRWLPNVLRERVVGRHVGHVHHPPVHRVLPAVVQAAQSAVLVAPVGQRRPAVRALRR